MMKMLSVLPDSALNSCSRYFTSRTCWSSTRRPCCTRMTTTSAASANSTTDTVAMVSSCTSDMLALTTLLGTTPTITQSWNPTGI